jgi:hypothetical protein
MFFAEISVIGIVIAVIVAAISMLFKKKEEEPFELPPELKPRRDKPPQPPRAGNWEDELRRVLEQRPAPPPIVREVPPPIYRPAAPPPPLPNEMEEGIEINLPVPQPQIEPTFQPLAGLSESTQRYAAASSLQQRVQQHLHDVTTHRVGSTMTSTATQPGVAPQFRELVDAFRTPGGARSAIIASVIFGPPRGLEGN